MTLNTSSVMMRNEVETCMDGLQKIQLKLPTDIQSLTSQLNQTKEDLLDTKEVISRLTEDFITLNTSSVKTRNKVESCMDDLQEIQLKLPTDIQSLTSQLNQTKEDLLDTKEVINGLEEDFITLNTSSVKTRNKVESCMDGLQEIQLKLPTDIQSLTSQLNQTKEDLLDTKEVINGLEEDFITLNTSSVKTRNKVESCMDDLQEIQLKLHTDIQSLTSQLNQTKEDLLDTKEVINGLEEDFITLNTSSVKTRNKVESCMDDLQEIQLKLPTDIQSLTSQLNQTKEDLLDTKEVISRLTEDFITLNTSCGMRKEVKPSDGNEGSSLSQVSPTTPTTTYPGNTTASTDPSLSNTASLAPVTTQHSDLHATPSPAAGRRLCSASEDGDLERVKRILAAGHVDINTRGGGYSLTPVMMAAVRGHRDVVEFLVGRGADVSLVDRYGYNVLHWASLGGDLEIVKLIVSRNVLDINARDNYGHTAVYWARRRGHPRVVEFLVSRGGH
ncbi:early endosome antigen 1-like isoform X2 [Haliotis rubra]|uniref:early endosome antigen 1-like isoform X2 n=1 Tax=Haliotis rubra TaxID=36100 RepID=UPI001EE57F2F|nr:early endosome antigen 1-like isoform X2 [Haliotis rubra]